MIARDLPLDASSPGAARRLVQSWLGDDDRGADAILAVSEIVTNAVQHSGSDPGTRITISLHHTDHAVRIEVSQPTRMSIAAPNGFPEPDRIRGRGLAVVEAVADRWGVAYGHEDRHTTTVWFEVSTA